MVTLDSGNDPQVRSITIDEEESIFFTRTAHAWWDYNGQFKSLHQLDALALHYIQNVLQSKHLECKDNGDFSASKDLLILDVGCGGGILSEPLTKAGYTVVGIDINNHLLNIAKEHAKLDSSLTKLTYHLESVEDHALKNNNKYDIVVVNFVLQHVKNHDVLLSSCVKALKPGGIIFASGVGKTFNGWLQMIVFGEFLFRLIPRNSHKWENFITAKDTEIILRQNDCVVNNPQGLQFGLLSLCWQWTKNTSGVYIMHAIKN